MTISVVPISISPIDRVSPALRPRQVRKPERAGGDEQRDRRIAGRKEYFRDRHGEEAVDQEVEPFEHVANRGGDDHAGEPRARRRRAANCGFHGHCMLLSFPALSFAIEPRLAHVAKRRDYLFTRAKVWISAVWRSRA